MSIFTLFAIKYMVAWYLFFYDDADLDMREVYAPLFVFLDVVVYIGSVFTVEMAIVERSAEFGCTYDASAISDYDYMDPSRYYGKLPDGCKVSGGLGVVLFLLGVVTMYASYDYDPGNLDYSPYGYILDEGPLPPPPVEDSMVYKLNALFAGIYQGLSYVPEGEADRRKRKTNRAATRTQTRGGAGNGGYGAAGQAASGGSNWEKGEFAGKVYYFNKKTGQTSWTRPEDYKGE